MKTTNENICFHFMIDFPLKFVFTCSISLMWWEINPNPNSKYILELAKRRSKVQEKNMSCERALSFDQWKTFSVNYKPIRVWLWLIYKLTENYCHSQLFSKFIQTQKRYPTFLDKISILTWKLFVMSSQSLPCKLNSQRTYSFQNIWCLSLRL